NAIVDQKIMSLRLMLGMNAAGVIGVAEPNRFQERTPSAISAASGIHAAIAPALCSHLPISRPTMLSATASVSPIIDTSMKYVLLFESACPGAPPMKSALPAAKYRSPVIYGRFSPQYVHPVMNPSKGPNAAFYHT